MLGSDTKEQLNELAAHLEEHLSDSLIAVSYTHLTLPTILLV